MKIQATIATLVIALISTAAALAYVVGGGMFTGEATAMPASGIDVAVPANENADAATGSATGRRQHAPITIDTEGETAAAAETTSDAPANGDEATDGTTDEGTTDEGTTSEDTGTEGTGTPEAGTPETGTPEAGTPETGTPGAGTPEAGNTDGANDAEATVPTEPAAPAEPAAPTTPSCAPAHHYDPVSGTCVPTIAPPLCAPGYVHNADATDCVSICDAGQYYDIAAGICRDVEIAPPLCIDGYVLNETLDGCVEPDCGDGHYFDINTHTCKEITIAPPLCAPGYVLNETLDGCDPKVCPLTHFLNDDGECELVVFTFCPEGQELVGGDCLPVCPPHQVRIGRVCTELQILDPAIICGPGETLVGGACIGLQLDPEIIGQFNPDLLPNVPPVVVNPVLPDTPVLPSIPSVPGGLILDVELDLGF